MTFAGLLRTNDLRRYPAHLGTCGHRLDHDSPSADDRPFAHISHDDRSCAQPCALADGDFAKGLFVVAEGFAIAHVAAVLMATGEDLNCVCEHDIIADVSPADGAEPADIDAVAQRGLLLTEERHETEVYIFAHMFERVFVERLPDEIA